MVYSDSGQKLNRCFSDKTFKLCPDVVYGISAFFENIMQVDIAVVKVFYYFITDFFYHRAYSAVSLEVLQKKMPESTTQSSNVFLIGIAVIIDNASENGACFIVCIGKYPAAAGNG